MGLKQQILIVVNLIFKGSIGRRWGQFPKQRKNLRNFPEWEEAIASEDLASGH